jgi:hypothetical protein
MGIKYEDCCLQCSVPCVNCGRKETIVPYCDDCGEDDETIYVFEGEELCLDCIVKRLEKV